MCRGNEGKSNEKNDEKELFILFKYVVAAFKRDGFCNNLTEKQKKIGDMYRFSLFQDSRFCLQFCY